MKNAKGNKKAISSKSIAKKTSSKKPATKKPATKKDVRKTVAKQIATKKKVNKPVQQRGVKIVAKKSNRNSNKKINKNDKIKNVQKATPKRVEEKEVEKVVVKRPKTETFISLQKELIRQIENSKKVKKTEEEKIADERRLKSLEITLRSHEKDNKDVLEKLSSLKKQIKRKNISKQNIKIKLNQISELEKLANTKEKSRTTTINGKQYLYFNTRITKDEISRIKGGDFDYYINDIFKNVLVVRSTEVKGDEFEAKVLDFIYAGLLEEQANLKKEIAKAKKEKNYKREKGLRASLYGIEKQMEKVYANQDVLDIKDETERAEALENAIDETEAPIMIERKNNFIRILG